MGYYFDNPLIFLGEKVLNVLLIRSDLLIVPPPMQVNNISNYRDVFFGWQKEVKNEEANDK